LVNVRTLPPDVRIHIHGYGARPTGMTGHVRAMAWLRTMMSMAPIPGVDQAWMVCGYDVCRFHGRGLDWFPGHHVSRRGSSQGRGPLEDYRMVVHYIAHPLTLCMLSVA
jgi:hypothetical protein